MKTEIFLCPTPDDLALEAARIFAESCEQHAAQATGQATGGIFCVLTGGRTPGRTYELLTGPEYRKKIPWERLYLFWGDERHVPTEDPRNNAGRVLPLLHPVPIPQDHLFPVPTRLKDPQEAAGTYERTIREVLQVPGRIGSVFDLIFLGLGEDGHTASLFPGSPALREMNRWVVAFKRESEDFHRITLTFPILNHARRVVFLVSGKEKAAVLKEVLYTPRDPWIRPAQGIHPANGRVQWLVDQEAASLLIPEELTSLGYTIHFSSERKKRERDS